MTIRRLRSTDATGVVINYGRDKDLRMLPFGPPDGCATPIRFKVAPGVGSSCMTDVLYCANCPAIFSGRCVQALRDIFDRDGRLVEAAVAGAQSPYFVFAPGRALDCIDEARSVISRTAFVTHVGEAAYKPCDLGDIDLFLAEKFEWSGLFVTTRFAELFDRHGFTGACFPPT